MGKLFRLLHTYLVDLGVLHGPEDLKKQGCQIPNIIALQL